LTISLLNYDAAIPLPAAIRDEWDEVPISAEDLTLAKTLAALPHRVAT
jgi:hypothetical protein